MPRQCTCTHGFSRNRDCSECGRAYSRKSYANKMAGIEKQKTGRKVVPCEHGPRKSQCWICQRERLKWHQREVRTGCDRETYEAMLKEQDGKCAICFKQMVSPFVDHCHSSGKVRGLLCITCNSGLGYFKDNIGFLQNAIEYLQER